MHDLPARIRAARQHSGLSQRALAHALGVTPGAVGHWETGRTTPSARHLLELAGRIGLDLAGLAWAA